MIRLLAACLIATVLLVSTCASSVFRPQPRSLIETTSTDAYRDLDHERARTQQLRSSLADRSQADEAMKALALLEELYQQEEKLWTYYEALHQSAQTRQAMIEQRIQLEQLVHQQQHIQHQLEKQLTKLRPSTESNIQFNN